MERTYETVCIIKPDIGDEAIKGIIQKAASSIEAAKGRVNALDEWGRRRLAYHIGKKSEGYYFVLNYTSSAEAKSELERILKYNEDVMRYQTIKLEEAGAAASEKEKASVEAGE